MLRRTQKGWLGIDIGCASVKVAQLARSDRGLEVIARTIVPRSAQPVAEEGIETEQLWSASGEISAALALGTAYRGLQAAVAMPMGLCEVHQLDTLPVDESDIDVVIRRAIEIATQQTADHLEYDVWPAESSAPQRWNVLAVARPWSDQVYRDVVQSGLSCHTIDGLPHALARAIGLTAQEEPLPPVAALDLGFGQATLCVIAEGRPAYVRSLKDCGLERILAAVADELSVTHEEAHLLLRQHDISRHAGEGVDEVTALLAELTTEPLHRLEQELSRTISHVSFQRKAIAPQRLVLFGGGALLRGLPRHLSRRLRLDTQVWSLNGEQIAAKTDCLFGVAIAMSALAWEKS
jgi:Tfp pilus assembly PilM family ATPase